MFQDYTKIFENWQKMFNFQQQEQNFFSPINFLPGTNIFQDFTKFYKNFQDSLTMNNYFTDFMNFQNTFKKFQNEYAEMVLKFVGLNSLNLPDMNFMKNLPLFNEDFLKVQPLGLTREHIETYQKLLENYKEYLEKMNQFRSAIFEKAKEGFEKFIVAVKDDQIFQDFDKAFKKWIEINENIFQDYFKSEEYCSMLKELISSTAKFRKSMDEFTYMTLKETNIATKWELDRAYRDIYNLKKEIKALKKEIEELKSQKNKK